MTPEAKRQHALVLERASYDRTDLRFECAHPGEEGAKCPTPQVLRCDPCRLSWIGCSANEYHGLCPKCGADRLSEILALVAQAFREGRLTVCPPRGRGRRRR